MRVLRFTGRTIVFCSPRTLECSSTCKTQNSHFHRTFMLLLVSVTFYRCIEKRQSKLFLPHFSTFVEILKGFKMSGFSGDISCLQLLHFIIILFKIRQRTIQKLQLKCHLKPTHRHLVKDKCFPYLFILI